MSSGMNSLLESEDLVDVTLAVQGKCLKAHKMVLSVCSPYFKELFKSNPCQHPIVFMKDVSYEALSDLLQFMYQGEVQVSQENLTTFIKTAEALQIKGLTADGNVSIYLAFWNGRWFKVCFDLDIKFFQRDWALTKAHCLMIFFSSLLICQWIQF
nr:unnamed protein product [Callosobruchus analis]